jgi:hypothetical protein
MRIQEMNIVYRIPCLLVIFGLHFSTPSHAEDSANTWPLTKIERVEGASKNKEANACGDYILDYASREVLVVYLSPSQESYQIPYFALRVISHAKEDLATTTPYVDNRGTKFNGVVALHMSENDLQKSPCLVKIVH